MATIIDALLVSFGMKTDGMKKGAQDVDQIYREMVVKAKLHAKEIVDAAKGKSAEEITAAKVMAAEVQRAEMAAARKTRDEFSKTTEKVKAQADATKSYVKGLMTTTLQFFGMLGAVGGMVMFAKSTMEAQISAGRLAKTLEMDVEDVEAFEGAAKRVGGTTEGMDNSLKGLNERLQLIAIHGPRSKMALQMFAGLGIKEAALKGKDAAQVMGLLAEKMEHLSGARALALGERLGLDEATIRLLQQGKASLEALTGQIRQHVASKEEVERSEQLHLSIMKVQGAFKTAAREILSTFMPALVAVGAAFAKVATWIRDHGSVVKATLLGIGAVFLALKAKAMVAALGMAKAAFVALGPWWWVPMALGAVVAVLYLLISHAKEVGNWFNWLAYHVVFRMLVAFFKVQAAAKKMWNGIKEAAMAPLEWIWNKLKAILDLYKQEGKFFGSLLHGDFKGAAGAVKAAVGDVRSVAGLTPAYAGPSAAMAMRPSTISNSRSTQVTRTTSVQIGTIQTQATDAQGLARDLPGAISQRSHGLVDQADTGF